MGHAHRVAWTRGSRGISLLLLFGVAILAPLAMVGSAQAHPLGNFTINRYARVEVYRDTVRVVYALDFAEIPTFQEFAQLDANNDGASESELATWAARVAPTVARDLHLEVGGQVVTLAPVTWRATTATGQSNLPILRLDAVFEAAPPVGIVHGRETPVRFSDANYADRLGWRELVIAPSLGAMVEGPAGYVDRSNQLQAYPATSLQGAPDEREVSFSWRAGTGEAAPPAAIGVAGARTRAVGGFDGLLGRDGAYGILLLAMVAAAGFGMLHALGPGHGKTVVAAYLAGSRGSVRDAFALGLTVTATHTAAVYLLGFVALVASAFIVPEKLYQGLSVASGILIVTFGASLLAQRLWRRRADERGEHRHHPWGAPHSHLHGDHDHDHDVEHTHPHPHPDLAVTAPVLGASDAPDRRGVILLGIAGGILPCPSAIVVMLAAISIGRVLFGMLLIVAFSAGLASVLVGIGLVVVLGQRIANRAASRWSPLLARAGQVQAALLILGPAAITIAGAVLTYRALSPVI